MGEELNLYKGRCANLQRDIQLSSTAVDRLNNDQGSMGAQLTHYKERVATVEAQLVQMQEEKTD